MIRYSCKCFGIHDAHGKFSRKFEFRFFSFEICTVLFVRSKTWMNFWKLQLRKNPVSQTFVNTKVLFLSVLPKNCGLQHEYLTSCVTLSGKKSNILFIKISWILKIQCGKKTQGISSYFKEFQPTVFPLKHRTIYTQNKRCYLDAAPQNAALIRNLIIM